jgi:hypothetical protein
MGSAQVADLEMEKATLPRPPSGRGEGCLYSVPILGGALGRVAFSIDYDNFIDEIAGHAKPAVYWLRMAVRDSRGKWTRTNKLSFHVRGR